MDEEDFSAKDYIFDLPKGRRRVVWNDIRYIKWKFNDQGFLSHQLKKLETDLKTVSKSSDKIVYVSHHIPIKEVVYEKPQSPNWSLFNAYQGSPDLGRLAFSNSKLRAIICGHSHIPDYKKVENVKCYNVSTRFGALKPTFIEI